jgi:AraC-like DNA-binding protein
MRELAKRLEALQMQRCAESAEIQAIDPIPRLIDDRGAFGIAAVPEGQEGGYAEAASPSERDALYASLMSRLLYRSRPDPVICRAALLLHNNPALSLRTLASKLGVSKEYLSRGLRTVLGTSPKQLVRIARIERALARAAAKARGMRSTADETVKPRVHVLDRVSSWDD